MCLRVKRVKNYRSNKHKVFFCDGWVRGCWRHREVREKNRSNWTKKITTNHQLTLITETH